MKERVIIRAGAMSSTASGQRQEQTMEWIAVFFAALLGSTVQTVTGFGCAAMIMLFLPAVFGLVSAASISGCVCLALTAELAWHHRKNVQWKTVLLPLIPYIAVSTLVIPLAKGADLHVLNIVFGLFLLLLSLWSFLSDKIMKKPLTPTPAAGIGFGAVSGLFSGLFSVGGPTIALYVLAATENKAAYLATIQLIFLVTNVTTTVTRAASGLIPVSLLPLIAVGIAGGLLGRYIGGKIYDRLNADTLRKVVYAFVGVSGLITLAGQLF